MSGSNYFTGSNIATPTMFTAGAPTGMANTGGGSIGTVSQTSASPVIGLCYVILNTSTTFTVSYYDRTNTLQSMSGTVGTLFSSIGLSFTVTAAGTAFAPNDGFLVYLSEIGQNATLNARQITGLSINVQQFQTSTTTPQDWGAAINALFLYCGRNPDVTGLIPPGFYRCDDLTSATNYQLIVQSNMTIYAYGAVIGTSKSTTANYGFVGTQTPGPSAASNITILGGTWGGLGRNGVLSTDNSLDTYDGTRTGKVFSLFVDYLTMRDVTVRGFHKGVAYTLYGDNLSLDNCSFWNSDGMTGSGGVRILNGLNIRVSNTSGRCGDDALQFAPISDPPPGLVSTRIRDAFFIGGTVYSAAARAILCAASSGTDGDYNSCEIARVGFIGITGSCGSTLGTVCKIENLVSRMSITDITVSSCKLLVTASTTTSPAVIINSRSTITGTAFFTGGVSRVVFTDVTVAGATDMTLYISGVYNNPIASGASTSTFMSNVELINCKLIPSAASTAVTAFVQQCGGFAFRGCEIYAIGTGTTNNALVLGISGNKTAVASHGIIDGCRFYTGSTTSSATAAAIYIANGDMNAVTGWTSFFLGGVPDIAGVTGTGQAISLATSTAMSAVTNTYIDNVDLRGLGNYAAVISDLGTNTVIGSNILTTAIGLPTIIAPQAVKIPAYTKSRVSLSSTNTWAAGATVLEFTNSGVVTGATIALPTAQRDGELRILASATGTFTASSSTLTGATVSGLASTAVVPGAALRLTWDAAGVYWLLV